MRRLKELIPWQVKFLFKYICSYFNINYKQLNKLNLVSYSSDSCFESIHNSFLMHLRNFRKNKIKKDFVFLEIGPGDKILYALCAFFYGSKKIYLIDQSHYLKRNRKIEKRFFYYLKNNSTGLTSIRRNLSEFKYTYPKNGLHSLKNIQNSSVDFILSNQVFEHIKKDEVKPFFIEIDKKLKHNGIASHRIDFRDHLGYSLNNLRFSERFWESEVIRKSLMYCNRLRIDDYVLLLKQRNIPYVITSTSRWSRLPIPLNQMSYPFRKKKKSVLRIQECLLRVQKSDKKYKI